MAGDQVFIKCAWRLIPFIMVLRLVHVLDRANVAFAALTMNKDLGFSAAVYGFGAGVFFIGYFLFHVPVNVVLERVGARRSIFCIMAVWGAVSAGTAFAQGPASFYAFRFLLGAAEAGFFPGVILYLTYWFPRAYRARLIAIFMTMTPLSFIIGGPLSGLILGMDGAAGLHGWQWLFLLEGSPTIFLAVAVLRWLPDRPTHASWLTGSEKESIEARLAAEDSTEYRDLWRALRDPRVLALGLVLFGLTFGDFGLTLWLPQIVQAMGFSNLETGFVVAPLYVAAMGAMVLWGWSSDAKGERIWHVALPALLAATGFIVASVAQDNLIVLGAFIFALAGIFSTYSPLLVLPSSFLAGPAAAGGIALINAIGILGGFLGPYVIGVFKDQTGGYAASMAVLACALVLSAATVLALGRVMAPRQTTAGAEGRR